MSVSSECTKKPLSIKEPNVIIGEGKDEKNFFERFISQEGLTGIEVRDIGGKTQLEDNLSALQTATGYNKVRTLGITRDADNNYEGAFENVQTALRNVGLAVPDAPLTLADGNPRIVVLIFPRPNRNGMLEDLCLAAVQDDPVIPCIGTFFQCIGRLDVQPNNISKAKVQAFLSTRKEECHRLGIAAHHNCWPFEHRAFDVIRELLGIITS